MCGIIGNFNRDEKIDQIYLENLISISKEINFRGPDYFDYYLDENKKIFLGHLRLSIIDTSSNANQPIFSKDKRFLISFNGEIYNFKELYKKLEISDNSILKSDTKVLVEFLSKYGVEKTLKEINGMFALAIFDIKENYLYLARDFFGKKPIFYYQDNNKIFFSSTLKPIIKNTKIKKILNKTSLEHYFNYGYCPKKQSIFENIFKLEENSYIKFDLRLWNNEIKKIHTDKFLKEEEKEDFSIKKLETLINSSVERRLVSDVPLCILQSSGIDSTLVSYLASKINKNIETYTVGFRDNLFDESKDSKNISKFLGLVNHKINLEKKDLEEIIYNIPDAFDEPFADSSQIPSMLIFKKISTHAKVCISGDGGDEVFYGYNRYQWYLIWQKLFKNNPLNNKIIEKMFSSSLSYLDKNFVGKKLLESLNITSNKSLKFLNIFFQKKNVYESFIKLSSEKEFINNERIFFNKTLESLKDLRDYDITNYLVSDILTKVDRSSMFYSVEARSPLLDKTIYDYVKNIPLKQNINFFQKKKLLKEILYKKVPKNLLSKTKRGFAVPIQDILYDQLKENIIKDINYFLKDERLKILNSNLFIQTINRFFNNNDYKLSYQVWSFYVFFQWFKKYEKYISS